MTDLENFRGDSRKSVLKFEGKRRWRVLSNVVRIRQDQETLQTIDLSFLKEWLMRQQLYFGVLNEAYALENYEKTDADIRGIRFVIFDRQCFGRGFQLLVEENYDLELTLNAFATERDVQSFFLGIRDLCEKLAVDEFEQEGERCFLDQIDALYKELIKQNRWLVKHRLQERTTIFGCIYPIMIEESLIRHLALLEEPAAYRLYERYLDEKQHLEAYYGKPVVLKEGSERTARYPLVEGALTILPLEGDWPQAYQLHELPQIQSWSVFLLKKKGEEGDLRREANIPYAEFMKLVRPLKCPHFDAAHLLVAYDEALDREVRAWQREQGRKRMIRWLSNERELGAPPARIEFVSAFTDADDVRCAIYKYKKSRFDKWLLGITSERGTFSEFREYREECAQEDARELLERLKTFWKRKAQEIERKEEGEKYDQVGID